MISRFFFPQSTFLHKLGSMLTLHYTCMKHFCADTCFVFRKRLVSFTLKITYLIQKHRSITLTKGVCGEGVFFDAWRVCRLCVAFQGIYRFEAVYAPGAVCGVTLPISGMYEILGNTSFDCYRCWSVMM